MGLPGWAEILIVLVIVLLLFGQGRISKVASEMGKGIRNFKDGLNGTEDEKDQKKESTSDDKSEKQE
jgi:sec-independent protein translocase protein TatA